MEAEPAIESAEESEVIVVASDPRWSAWYRDEAPAVVRAFTPRAIEIEHFGSSAVPGLPAKPVIDLLAGSRDEAPPARRELKRLSDLGYTYLGPDGRRAGRWFWRKRGPRAFNLSLVAVAGPLWDENLLLRDFLRAHPEAARTYGEVKREAAARCSGSLRSYQDRKRAFVEELKADASRWAESRAVAAPPSARSEPSN